MHRDAHISSCGNYRYWLSRVWDESRQCGVWVMLNPSTADAMNDDPTVRRVVGLSRSWGWGRIKVFNLFALRSHNPAALADHEDPVGPENDAQLRNIPTDSAIVAAWGNWGAYLGRAECVRSLFGATGVELLCIGLNKGGSPKHPLRVGRGVRPVPYSCTPVTLLSSGGPLAAKEA